MEEIDAKSKAAAKSETIKEGRRKFIRNSLVAGGTAASVGALGFPSIVSAQMDELQPRRIAMSGDRKTVGKANRRYIPASDKTVHWGYFRKNLKPVVEVESGDFVTIEALCFDGKENPNPKSQSPSEGRNDRSIMEWRTEGNHNDLHSEPASGERR